MKAIKIEIVIEDDKDAEYFITQVLPKLREEHGFKQVTYQDIQYFEK